MPARIAHIAFTADENYLLLSAEEGGGLAVYEVKSLLSGSTNTAFQLSTNGQPLRALAPNPAPEMAELCAVITNDGTLHMANLKEQSLSSGLQSQASCLSWSSKGKQLCTGLGDGSVRQLMPDGSVKDSIPSPPDLGSGHGKEEKSHTCKYVLTCFN